MNYFIIDHGTSFIKAASSQSHPLIIESILGIERNDKEKKVSLISSAEDKENYHLIQPINKGMIVDIQQTGLLWQNCFDKLEKKVQECDIIYSLPLLTPISQRRQIINYFLEKLEAKSIQFQLQPIMALYSEGITTGLSVDIGTHYSQIVPIVDGYFLKDSISKVELAGYHVDQYLQLLLRRKGYGFSGKRDMEIVRKVKEKMAQVNQELKCQDSEKQTYKEPYVMPDGNIIEVGEERMMAPEILFYPSHLGYDQLCNYYQVFLAVQDQIIAQINKNDQNLYQSLFANIHVSGGCSMLNGFGQRLISELRKAVQQQHLRIRLVAKNNRNVQAALGGQMMAKHEFFWDQQIDLSKWQEMGDRVLAI